MSPIILFPFLMGQIEQIESIKVRAAKDLLNSNKFSHINAIYVSSDNVINNNNTMADWLTHTPSFSLNGQGGLYQSYSLRGMSRWRVKTYVNDTPIMTDRRAGNSASFLDPAIMSTASIITGSNSLLYGSGAIAGVVSFESADYDALNFFSSHSSSDDEISVLIGNGNDEYSVSFAHRSKNEGKAANGDTIYSAFEQSSFSFNAKQKINTELELKARWIASLSSDVQKSSSEDFAQKQSIYPHDFHSLFDVSIKSKDWVFNFYNHYQNWDSQVTRTKKRQNLTTYQSNTFGSSFYREAEFYKIPIRFGVDWTTRQSVKINDKETSFNNTQTITNKLIDGSFENIGAYTQSQFEFNSLEFSLGARVDFISLSNLEDSKQENQISSNFSTKYNFNDAHSSMLSLGQAFRFPTLTELFFNGITPRGNTVGNDNLKAEKSFSYEFSHNIQLDHFDFKATYFETRLDDYIERIKLDKNTRTYINLNKANIKGYEVSLSFDTNSILEHSLSYSKQSGQDQRGQRLNDISPSKLNIKSKVNLDKFNFIADIMYRPTYNTVGPDESPLSSALSANIKANWAITDEFTASIGITNIFNKLYKTTTDEDAPYINERKFKLAVNWVQI